MTQVKQKIIQITLLLFAVAMTLYFLYHNGKTLSESAKFKDISTTYDIINLGNSHGNSFNYDALNIHGKSFNRGANSPYYDLQNYKYLKPYLKKKAIVVIPISYFSFGIDENRTDLSNDSFVNDFYQYLPNDAIYEFSYKKKFSLLIHDVKSGFFQLFVSSQKLSPELDTSLSRSEKLIVHANGRAKRHKVKGEANNPKKNIAYYATLISLIRQAGHQPILVTTPYFSQYNANFDQIWLKKHFQVPLDSLITRFDVPYLNFASDERFSDKIDLFEDSDHLNSKGQIFFSRVFFKELESVMLNEDKSAN